MKLLKRIQKENNIAYLFISHDLGVVRYMSENILVMYLGAMVEYGSSEQKFNNPLHPYTKALLSAIPRPDPNKRRKFVKLEGKIPTPSNYPSGCPFHTRCPIAQEHCKVKIPEGNRK